MQLSPNYCQKRNKQLFLHLKNQKQHKCSKNTENKNKLFRYISECEDLFMMYRLHKIGRGVYTHTRTYIYTHVHSRTDKKWKDI